MFRLLRPAASALEVLRRDAGVCKSSSKRATRFKTFLISEILATDEEEVDVEGTEPNPLDALFQMAEDKLVAHADETPKGVKRELDPAVTDLSRLYPLRKKRKSRTAFSGSQIGDLEKRFARQKYLTPVDRDELAKNLNLTAAQVITWFQNRRAKLKRDIEELRNDVDATKRLVGDSPDSAAILSCSPRSCSTPDDSAHSTSSDIAQDSAMCVDETGEEEVDQSRSPLHQSPPRGRLNAVN